MPGFKNAKLILRYMFLISSKNFSMIYCPRFSFSYIKVCFVGVKIFLKVKLLVTFKKVSYLTN